jgi:hypothetical protein
MARSIWILTSALVLFGIAERADAKTWKEEILELAAQLAAESITKGEISKLESKKLDRLFEFVTSCNLSSISNPLSFILCVDHIINSGNDPVADALREKEEMRAIEALQRHNVYIEKFCPVFLSKGLPEWQRMAEKALEDYKVQLQDESLSSAIAERAEKKEAREGAIRAFQDKFDSLRRKKKEYDVDVRQSSISLASEKKIIEEAREQFEREQRTLLGPWIHMTPHEWMLEWYRQRVPNIFSQDQVDQFLQEYQKTGSYPEVYPPGANRPSYKWNYDWVNRGEATIRASRAKLESRENNLQNVMDVRLDNLRREKRRIEDAEAELQEKQGEILELRSQIEEDDAMIRDLADQALRRQGELRKLFEEILAYEELFRTCIWNMEHLSKETQLRSECPMWRDRVGRASRKFKDQFDAIRKP